TREYQTDQSSSQAARLPLALRSKVKNNNKSHPRAVQRLTRSLHISPCRIVPAEIASFIEFFPNL
ncbi:MAG TPA: hypothetical protein VME23_22275, partial [Terracidiphilus sp.]|nr:hypothetical protein [Terracidiphilus sp.]